MVRIVDVTDAKPSFSKALEQPDDNKGFRVDKAAKIAFIALAATLTAATVAAVVTAVVLPCAATIVIAVVSAVALTIFVGARAAWQASPHLPKPLQRIIEKGHGLFSDFVGAAVLGAVFPFDYTKYNTKAEDYNPNKPTVIFINGYLGSSNNFFYIYKRLKKEEYNFRFVNVGDPLKNSQDHVKTIRDEMDRFQRDVGYTVTWVPVCHSMGGLLAKDVWSDPDNKRKIPLTTTLCTPHEGTEASKLVSFYPKGCGSHMTPDHEWVKRLSQQEHDLVDKPRQLLFYSKDDWIVKNGSAKRKSMKGDNIYREKLKRGIGHIWCMFDDEAATKICNAVKYVESNLMAPVA
ncbi:MAG: alpha/beta hydrolase [Chlamydiales bacterium]|nr:alpha/beta hydrolase [Chlamydiia bacterium]MCP5507752.1 alpha/beta hydrolase [Chlamydiales bacterium]